MTKSERRRVRAAELDRQYEAFLLLHEKVTGVRLDSCTREYRDRCLGEWVNRSQVQRANREAIVTTLFPPKPPEENPHGAQATPERVLVLDSHAAIKRALAALA